tara:strand:+ start:714 stop:1907 length:1194 start_codon:yes stop_codon:yes gene_type:complete
MKTMQVNCAHKQLVPLHKLVPHPRNPNTHPDDQIRLLTKIIDYQGWRNPIVVSNRSGFIIKGHARLMAAQQLGYSEAPVDYQDYADEAQEWADLIADNRIAELAVLDRPVAKDLLEEMDIGDFDMELTGWDPQALEDLMTEFHVPEEGLTDDDAVPEPTEAICKTGDLWKLGNHRLLCGDATVITDVDRLMDGEKADMVFTDPPYGVDYTGKTVEGLKIQNDKDTDIFSEAVPFIPVVAGGAWYVCCPAGNNFIDFEKAFLQRCFQSSTIIWVKNSLVLGHGDYHYKHEPILYGWEKGSVHKYYGGRDQTTVWEIERPSRSSEHPIMKPVLLSERAINNSSRIDNIVLDPFGGSGSTLIACEKLSRRCYMMEIDQHYCDVIIKRWEDFTGKIKEKIE